MTPLGGAVRLPRLRRTANCAPLCIGLHSIVKEKLLSLPEAIRVHVSDGDCLVLGASLEVAIPFAATYEIIRQGNAI